ncbi:hypothetical protein ACFPVX_20435 [Cohnella faecalis]|uniref:Uncharacterized protein n=1 Tax=Cohnella faecalis TaxID=2315694 RepID=A0A398CP89_9BACL|nr:hypothetical protein [Cohnella faecalis]RIE04202.1 hypothetical protein D3H35_06165 [Cohnella faecalis]
MDEVIEKLFSFLLGHIYIVVVVIGFIYSIFFRKSPIEKKPPNRMPDFGGGGSMLPQRPKRQTSPAGMPSAESSRPFSQQTASSDVRSLAERSEQSQASSAAFGSNSNDGESRYVALSAAGTPAVKAAVPIESSSEVPSVLTRTDMRRAIVWAEIIGPPRARKPFRR